MSASVAANDIWKLGWTTAWGEISSTASAATARVRNVSAARSIMTPSNTMAVMTKARWVATSAPDNARYAAAATSAAAALHFLMGRRLDRPGMNARIARTTKNTTPATSAM